MKVLVVTQYFWPEQFKINDLCEALIERGHEVTVYTGLPNYPEGQFFKGYSFQGPYKEAMGKVKIIRIPLIPRGKSKILLAVNYIWFCLVATILAPILVRGKFDKIFVYQLSPIFAALPAVLLKYLKRAPIIIWVTDLWPDSLEATGIVKNKKLLGLVGIFVKYIYFESDKIFITSRGFENKIKSFGISSRKILFWPQWAESLYLRKSDPDFNDLNIPATGFKLMFAGNIGSAQDFETIIQASIILKEHTHIHFLILGDGSMREWSEKEIKKNNLDNQFHFLGRKPVGMMPDYFSKADVMLMSLTESELFSITVPSKLQSYLASKKPILASMNGEGAKIVEDWKAGVSVPATRPDELAKAILKMSQLSKEELHQMGENAFNCYEKEFEREMLITKLEEEFRSL